MDRALMKANFPACLAITLRFEGLYTDNPKDPGGPTMKGVTQRVYDAYRHGPLGYRSVRYIAENEVQDIYRHQYWDAIRGDDLPAGVDLIAFDISVNSGVGRATQWLAASAGYPPLERIYYLDSSRCSFWRKLLSFATFGRGWLNREKAVKAAALKMQTPRASSSLVSPI